MFLTFNNLRSPIAALFAVGVYQVLLALLRVVVEPWVGPAAGTAGPDVLVGMTIGALVALLIAVAVAAGACVADSVSAWAVHVPSWHIAFAEMSSSERRLVLGMVNLIVTGLLIVQLSHALPV